MKVFISIKVPRGNQALEQLADLTAETVRSAGHKPFVATYEIADLGMADPKDFMSFVRERARESDLMVVLYHPELRGGLIEIGIAYADNIPIWLFINKGQRISSSALGCANLTVEYTCMEDFRAQFSAHLAAWKPVP